jgi:hypothetical protein
MPLLYTLDVATHVKRGWRPLSASQARQRSTGAEPTCVNTRSSAVRPFGLSASLREIFSDGDCGSRFARDSGKEFTRDRLTANS